MERLIVARHGESEYSARGLVNGDPAAACSLTDRGRADARRLGELLRDEPIELCAVTQFARTRETAELALAGRDVPFLVVPELNDNVAGEYEGKPLDEYLVWARAAAAVDVVPGARESLVDTVTRFASGYRALLERPEETVLAVLHSLPISYLLAGPVRIAPLLGYAEPAELTAAETAAAVERLEAWVAAPSW